MVEGLGKVIKEVVLKVLVGTTLGNDITGGATSSPSSGWIRGGKMESEEREAVAGNEDPKP